jgi:ubiquinone/menaquinone biosynthesis C-methylase UbiE
VLCDIRSALDHKFRSVDPSSDPMSQDERGRHAWYNERWFRRMAPVYDLVETVVARLRDEVARSVRGENAQILDVACGTGNQTIAFADHGHRVTGIDLSSDMLRRAATKLNASRTVTLVQGDGSELPFPDRHFDVTSISFGLHDMPEIIGVQVLREMVRTVRDGGQVLIVDYRIPDNRVVAQLSRWVLKLWETCYFDDYMEIGVQHYLLTSNLAVTARRPFLLGNVEVLDCAGLAGLPPRDRRLTRHITRR